MTFGQLSKKLGDMWNALTHNEKKAYSSVPAVPIPPPLPSVVEPSTLPLNANDATICQLRSECQKHKLKRTGNKKVLIERLQAFYETHVTVSCLPPVLPHPPPIMNDDLPTSSTNDVANKTFVFKDDDPDNEDDTASIPSTSTASLDFDHDGDIDDDDIIS